MRQLLIACVLLMTASAMAQIPNPGFESWSTGNPVGWTTSNINGLVANISQSSIVHGGSAAVRGEAVAFYTQILQPVLQSGAGGRGFPYAQRAASFSGYYQFFPVSGSGDRFGVNTILYKGGVGGTAVAVAALAPSTGFSTYTRFNAPFVYLTADIPDTCVIQFQIVGPGTGPQATPKAGSYFLIDDLALEGVAGSVEDGMLAPSEFALQQNFPNPFNPATTISYQLPAAAHVKLTVYDVLGHEIAVLVDSRKAAGYYSAAFDASRFPSGLYLCKLAAGEYTKTIKMVLTK